MVDDVGEAVAGQRRLEAGAQDEAVVVQRREDVAEPPLQRAVMWTVRPKVVASKQLTKATVVGRTLAVSQVVFMLVSLCRCGGGLLRVEHRDEMRTIAISVSHTIRNRLRRCGGVGAALK